MYFCVSITQGNAASYAALGFTKHLTGNIDGAIESYHRALSMKPDDTFSGEMLNRALHEALSKPDRLIRSDGEETNLNMSFDQKGKNTSFASTKARNFFDNSAILNGDAKTQSAFSMATGTSSNLSLDYSDVDMSYS